ncbi:MAG: Omp28-related outer membrane protein [Flavobacteriales bacterium]|nr:Omp28-related outer membrane protein [Flavobacteriales bacterium]
MKKHLLVVVLTFCALISFEQSFSDDFESYAPGSMLGEESDVWTTWSGNDGGADDVQVSDANANSGSNSVYFSSTSANGGPQDCVLPFPGELNVGQFNFEMWMYVNSGTGAYFNFQSEDVIGTTWAMDAYFLNTGAMQFTSGGSLQLQTDFPFAQWFKLRMENNLSTNTWQIFVNDEPRGSFSNGETQIASMDIFPLQGNQFYIDDVSYEFTDYPLPALNGAITAIEGMSNGLAGQVVSPGVIVRNLGTTTINSFTINVNYDGTEYSQNVSGLNLSSLAFYTVDFADEFTLEAGEQIATAVISNVNGMGDDGDMEDDVKELIINPVVPAAGKMVVAEEATGTWCPWCVRGHVFMEYLTQQYENYFIGIAVHNADPMAFDAYDVPMGGMISGYPSGLVDRGPEYDPSQFEIPFLERVQIDPTAFLENGATYDEETRELNVSVSTTYQTAASGNWKIALVLTENGVTGTGSDWAQANAYAGGAAGEMGGYEDLPATVPASQMVYEHVARFVSPNFGGLSNAFGTSMTAGQEFVHNFSVVLPVDWDASNIHMVGMVIAPNGTIDNASYTTIEEAESNGFVDGTDVVGILELSAPDAPFKIYPNPAADICNLNLQLREISHVVIEVYSADGRLVLSRDYGTLSGGNIFPINTSIWESGIYSIKLMTNEKYYTERLIKK